MTPEVHEFRERFRATNVGPHYSGGLHLAATSLLALGGIVAALSGIEAPSWGELCTVPLAFLVANLAEYLAHRGPMHHRRAGLAILFKRHTLFHHHCFTDDTMAFDTLRDAKMVLFPFYVVLFFLGGIGLPLGGLVWWVAGANAGRLFVAVAVGYYLTYEWLHFSYHVPPGSFVGRMRVVAMLRRHHQAHHRLAWMGRYNFNVTFPICDRLFGTMAPDR